MRCQPAELFKDCTRLYNLEANVKSDVMTDPEKSLFSNVDSQEQESHVQENNGSKEEANDRFCNDVNNHCDVRVNQEDYVTRSGRRVVPRKILDL